MNKIKIFTLFILIFLPLHSFSQLGTLHEVGVIAGGMEFRSDYGQRNSSKTNLNNLSFEIALVDYLNFSYNDYVNNYFTKHFKVRNEFSFSKTKLQHYGQWVEKNNLASQQLKAMRGTSQLVNFGIQLEYSFTKIRDFEYKIGGFNPYIALGPKITYYPTSITSELGELGSSTTTYPKYLVPSDGRPYGFSNESDVILSVAINFGTRYKLTRISDLVFDIRAQYFNSDWVDGLNINKELFIENKSNDWLTFAGIGYIIYLN